MGVNYEAFSTHNIYDDNLASDRSRSELRRRNFQHRKPSQFSFHHWDIEKAQQYNDLFFLYESPSLCTMICIG